MEGASPPQAWVLSRICEEFGVPLVQGGAVDQPYALALEVLELRAYARAKEALDRAKSEADVPTSPAVEWVWKVQNELFKRKRAAREKG